MKWKQLFSKKRFKVKNHQICEAFSDTRNLKEAGTRSDFLIDYDRVIFASSFRRLGRKTQVHPFSEDGHTHNRLTHSIEVASVGRSIGNQLGVMLAEELPPDVQSSDLSLITQVACLAHDMGNPPFGHAGEAALRDWFTSVEHRRYIEGMNCEEVSDLCTYEGNAHTLRIVLNLEMYRGAGGMRLTAASIGSLVKYPWTSSDANCQGKFSIYQSELLLVEEIFQELGLTKIGRNQWARHPLSYLMEAADDICYALLDLEDAVELGVLSPEDIQRVLKPIDPQVVHHGDLSSWQYCKILRGRAIGKAITDVVHAFVNHKREIMAGDFWPKDLLSVCSPEISESIESAKQLAREKIFKHSNRLMTEIAAFPCLGSILSLLIPAAYDYVQLTNKSQLSWKHLFASQLLHDNPLSQEDSFYTAYMKVLDFVGGLTDDAAAKMAREVSGIGMLK